MNDHSKLFSFTLLLVFSEKFKTTHRPWLYKAHHSNKSPPKEAFDNLISEINIAGFSKPKYIDSNRPMVVGETCGPY